jgi:hypothetical protein
MARELSEESPNIGRFLLSDIGSTMDFPPSIPGIEIACEVLIWIAQLPLAVPHGYSVNHGLRRAKNSTHTRYFAKVKSIHLRHKLRPKIGDRQAVSIHYATTFVEFLGRSQG